jgi:hypothetical protein
MNLARVVAHHREDGTLELEVDDPFKTGQTLISIELLSDMIERLNEMEQNEKVGNPTPTGEHSYTRRLFYRTTRDRSAVARLRRRDSHRSRQSSGSN